MDMVVPNDTVETISSERELLYLKSRCSRQAEFSWFSLGPGKEKDKEFALVQQEIDTKQMQTSSSLVSQAVPNNFAIIMARL